MKHLKVETRDSVQFVTLNRPKKRNAFDPEMIAEISSVFKKPRKIRAIVLSGEGPSFCAGGDLDWMKSTAEFTKQQNRTDAETLFDMYETVRTCMVPVIGRAHGHAMGGGLGLLAVCDIVAAETNTQFCFSEVRVGLVPAVISSFVLRKMQPHKLCEWMLTAARFSAAEAQNAGLIHFHGSSANVDGYVDRILGMLMHAGPRAVAETKKLLTYLPAAKEETYREKCAQVIAEVRVSPEGQAGLKSFLEKKQPPWV